MSDTVENKILTTEELLSDFFFLIFQPKPDRNIVRVIIDDGSIKLYTNIQKFVKIIESTMGEKASIIARNCCETYGCFYLIDRCKDDIMKLNINTENDLINLKQLHNDILKAKAANESDDSLREKYIKSLNERMNPALMKGSTVNTISGNRYSSTIIYGQQPKRDYRPY